MRNLIIALMMLIVSTAYTQNGNLGKTIEEVNFTLEYYGLPPAINGISADSNVYISDLNGYGEAAFYIDPILKLTTKSSLEFNTKKEWRKYRRHFNRIWERSIRSRGYRQWYGVNVEGYMIYINMYKECLTIEWLLEIEEL